MAAKAGKKQVTLTQALAQFLAKTLLPDLKARAAEPAVNEALQRQWQAEKAANRTADGFPAWQQRTLEQVGAAWVLSCVFVRTLEDRDLLARRRLAGPGALDSEQLFFELAPSLTARDYLLIVFKEVSSLPGAEELLGPRHNPLWRLGPSAEVASDLLGFFRKENGDGSLVWRFDGADTRFLGNLYQDLSEDVRKRFALLQTPDFVERFILEQTLEPAIAEFGLQTVRVIDPTCGSGHFLLGAFDRLLSHRQENAPAVDVRDHALAALGQVYGVDVNPYAVAIARFRLTLAYLQRTGITKLAHAPKLPLNLVVADSLLHGAKDTNMLFAEHELAAGDYKAWGAEMFELDDPQAARRVFGQRYHAVVGNPPYITCKDAVLREEYRSRYKSASGKYALSAPFTERFFNIAMDSGFVGMINASSFTKREFGTTLIESVLPEIEITKIIDTSGAYIPGHGTPTLLMFGRNRRPVSSEIIGVLRKRGERKEPRHPELAPAWLSITSHHNDVGFENEYFSVELLPRVGLSTHPWITRGGGVRQLKKTLEDRAEQRLGRIVSSIGFMAITGEDEVFARPLGAWKRSGAEVPWLFDFGIGENIRNWSFSATEHVLFPYRDASLRQPSEYPGAANALWPWRRILLNRPDFGGKKYIDVGRPWFSLHQVPLDRLRVPLSIAFAFVSSHNHFVLDRGGKVFKQSAPIIKLPESATENQHFALLAYLNSSTACFWMKQIFYPKGGDQMGDGGRLSATEWEDRCEFAGTGLLDLPLPILDQHFASFGRRIDDLAQRRGALLPAHILANAVSPDAVTSLAKAREEDQCLFEQMVALQEELDWHTYKVFGLIESTPTPETTLQPGHRAFECMAWNHFADDDPDREWFRRSHFSEPAPARLEAVATMVQIIQASRDLSLIEDFNYKRRWKTPEYDVEVQSAVNTQFLDAIEATLQTAIHPMSARRLVDTVVASKPSALLPGSGDQVVLIDLIQAEAVPMCTPEVLQAPALEKCATWRQTWVLQRREDLGEAVGAVPVPREYDPKDFRDANYWRLRGKLDVPKERFISYPGCEKDGDPSPLIGWAGWNHLQCAQALVALYQERKNEDGWPRERLMPMLVGLHELMFWLEQWHSQPEAGSQNPAREFKQFLDAELNAHRLTTDDLEAWRPPTRKAAAKRSRKASTETDTP